MGPSKRAAGRDSHSQNAVVSRVTMSSDIHCTARGSLDKSNTDWLDDGSPNKGGITGFGVGIFLLDI
jgi:hypothetical protein